MEKRILIVTDYFYPHWTGISKSFYNLFRFFKEQRVSVLTVRFNNKLKNEEMIEGKDVIRTDYSFRLSRSFFSLQMIFKFIGLLSSFDTVVINSPSAHILFITLIAKLTNKKIIIFHQGDLILPQGFKNIIIEKLFDLSSLVSFMLADKIGTYSLDYAKSSRVMKRFSKKTFNAILPVELEKEKGAVLPQDKVIKKLKRNDSILFGFAGRFVEEKGFDLLFDVIFNIVKTHPNFHFIYAGEVNMKYEDFFRKNRYKFAKIKQNIIMLGLLDGKKMAQFYKIIDFIIIPSRSDCFNLVQAEAMLSGAPSIVADIPGASYLVKETGFGEIFRNGDIHDMEKAIISAVIRRNEIVKNHYKVVEILDSKKNAEKIKNIIRS